MELLRDVGAELGYWLFDESGVFFDVNIFGT